MRVRIIQTPTGTVDGIDLSTYRIGRVHEVSSSLGALLIIEGWAELEMRHDPQPELSSEAELLARLRAAHARKRRKDDRRR